MGATMGLHLTFLPGVDGAKLPDAAMPPPPLGGRRVGRKGPRVLAREHGRAVARRPVQHQRGRHPRGRPGLGRADPRAGEALCAPEPRAAAAAGGDAGLCVPDVPDGQGARRGPRPAAAQLRAPAPDGRHQHVAVRRRLERTLAGPLRRAAVHPAIPRISGPGGR